MLTYFTELIVQRLKSTAAFSTWRWSREALKTFGRDCLEVGHLLLLKSLAYTVLTSTSFIFEISGAFVPRKHLGADAHTLFGKAWGSWSILVLGAYRWCEGSEVGWLAQDFLGEPRTGLNVLHLLYERSRRIPVRMKIWHRSSVVIKPHSLETACFFFFLRVTTQDASFQPKDGFQVSSVSFRFNTEWLISVPMSPPFYQPTLAREKYLSYAGA